MSLCNCEWHLSIRRIWPVKLSNVAVRASTEHPTHVWSGGDSINGSALWSSYRRNNVVCACCEHLRSYIRSVREYYVHTGRRPRGGRCEGDGRKGAIRRFSCSAIG